MKKLLLFQTVFLLSSSFISLSFGQATDYLQKAYQYIETKYGLDKKTIGDLRITDQYRTEHNNALQVYMTQTYNGIDINGTSISLSILPDGRIFSAGHRLKSFSPFPVEAGEATITPAEAITIVAGSLGIKSRAVPEITRYTQKGIPVYGKADIALQDMPVEPVYYLTPSGKYHLAWKIQIEAASDGNLYQAFVDATDGKSLANDMLTLHCRFEDGYMMHESTCDEMTYSPPVAPPTPINGVNAQYKVLAIPVESPIHGNFTLVSGIEDPMASPFGWHDTNGAAGAEYTYTRGNNVHAFIDRNWDYTPDMNVDGGANLTFDFPFNSATEPVDNQNVAATNLFYMNNIMHDFSYRYGFNEAAGNYQENNYTGLGSETDYVEALGQFGANNTVQCGAEAGGGTECINNASFSPPSDGFNGLMVMYVWNQDNGSKYLDVLEPVELAGKILTGLADFGPELTTTPITGEVVIIDDGTFDGEQGCNPVPGQQVLAGKIAMIDRGLCDFSEKVYNAQNAGAIGAIICNFEDAIIQMGGAAFAADVTIPSVFISSQECNRIRIAAGSGLVVSLVAPSSGGPVYRDGTVDNGIVSHEYGHGISNRLTGGPGSSGCLGKGEGQGMGEGWSDFFSLVTTARAGDAGEDRRGIGTYAIKEQANGGGIRSYPYSTDMTINPQTYNDIQTETDEHAIGAVWCAMIWDLYWAFSDEYGWDPDLYNGTGGNNIAIQLVMDGLKLQPCNPGFIDARDAILQADSINNGGANACLIWSVFARRGLGFDARQGDANLSADGSEGFELPIACRNDLTISKSMTPEVVAGQNIEVTIHVTSYKDETLTNVFIEDLIPDGCTYLPGSANIPPSVGNSLVWSINSIAPDESLTLTYLMKTDVNKNSVRTFYDDMEGDATERWDITFDPDGTTGNFWYPQDAVVHSGVSAWYVGDVDTKSEHYLENIQPLSITGNYPVCRFYHYYNTETGVDGGFLEVFKDAETGYVPLESQIFRNGYPRKLKYETFVIPNLNAFTGLSGPNFIMTPVYVDLSEFKGQNIKLRYRFGTDDKNGGDGWYMDDVELMDAVLYNSEVCITSDQSEPVCAEAPERGTIVDTEITSATEDGDPAAAFKLMPNPAGDLIQVVMSATRTDKATVNIYDLTGHLLIADNWGLSEGVNQKTIDISKLTSGMYVMQIKTLDGMRSEKFVKE